MDIETGEIKQFMGGIAPSGWKPIEKGEIVQIKGVYFKVTGIQFEGNMLNLKGISKKEGVK